jgi:gliding motility-associated-like protein
MHFAGRLRPCSNFKWTALNSGNIVSGPNLPNPTVNEGGNYRLIITDDCGSCSDTAFVTINEDLSIPGISATGGMLNCNNLSATVGAQSTTSGVTYSWDIPGVGIVNQQFVVVNNPGQYVVTVTAPNGCTNTAYAIVSQDNTHPAVSATGAIITCADPAPQIEGSSTTTGVTFVWMGPGNFKTTQPSPHVDTEGAYTLIVTGPNGCTANSTVTVTKDMMLPEVVPGPDQKICLGQTASITASGNNWVSIEWRNAQGLLLDTTSAVQVTPSAAGLFTYTVIAIAENGCTASATALVSVGPLLHAKITGTDSVCVNQFTVLTASGADSYVWQNGMTGSMLTYYPMSGQNTMTLIASSSFGCTQMLAYQVVGKPYIQAVIDGNTPVCKGSSDTLHVNFEPTGSLFSWAPGGGTLDYLIVVPQASTTYKVTVEAPGYCPGKDSVEVQIKPLPLAQAGNDRSICPGATTTLQGSGGGTYLWNTGQTTAQITVNPSTTTAYILSVNQGGCSGSDTVLVTVNPAPVATINGANTICAGQSALITLTTNGSKFKWSDNDSLHQSRLVYPAASGTYSVTVTGSNGCTQTAQFPILVNPKPDISIEETGTNQPITVKDLCFGSNISLSATGAGASTYQWNTGSSNISITQTPLTTTDYQVIGISNLGCRDTARVKVQVHEPGKVLAVSDTVFYPPGLGISERVFKVLTNDQIQNGTKVSVTILASPVPVAGTAQPLPDGTIQYMLTNTAFRGIDSLLYQICDSICPGPCSKAKLYIVVQDDIQQIENGLSNTFTPNGDAYNDFFDPLSEYIAQNYVVPEDRAELVILNRWGETVFHAAHPYHKWDGKSQGGGHELPVGTYYYVLNLDIGKTVTVRGAIMLLR